MDIAEAKRLLKAGEFGAGSMGPKVEAAVQFVHEGGGRAVIADLAGRPRSARAGTPGPRSSD